MGHSQRTVRAGRAIYSFWEEIVHSSSSVLQVAVLVGSLQQLCFTLIYPRVGAQGVCEEERWNCVQQKLVYSSKGCSGHVWVRITAEDPDIFWKEHARLRSKASSVQSVSLVVTSMGAVLEVVRASSWSCSSLWSLSSVADTGAMTIFKLHGGGKTIRDAAATRYIRTFCTNLKASKLSTRTVCTSCDRK